MTTTNKPGTIEDILRGVWAGFSLDGTGKVTGTRIINSDQKLSVLASPWWDLDTWAHAVFFFLMFFYGGTCFFEAGYRHHHFLFVSGRTDG